MPQYHMNAKDREEFTILKNDVEHIKNDVSETKKTVNDFNNQMTKITQKLFNDAETGEEGYISVAMNNRVRLTKLENIKVAIIAILMTLGGVFGWIAKSIIK
jgi:predicted  nucleic acid-binding Zn-ribbon protein